MLLTWFIISKGTRFSIWTPLCWFNSFHRIVCVQNVHSAWWFFFMQCIIIRSIATFFNRQYGLTLPFWNLAFYVFHGTSPAVSRFNLLVISTLPRLLSYHDIIWALICIYCYLTVLSNIVTPFGKFLILYWDSQKLITLIYDGMRFCVSRLLIILRLRLRFIFLHLYIICCHNLFLAWTQHAIALSDCWCLFVLGLVTHFSFEKLMKCSKNNGVNLIIIIIHTTLFET